MEAFVPWAEVIDRAWQLGAEHPEHLVSDGNGAIAAGIGLVYGGEGHISRARFACCGSICGTLGGGGICGGAAAECRQFSGSGGLCGALRETDGAASYWCAKALVKGLRHLMTGQASYRTTSRLERHNRELRRREQLRTVWTEHNLLALLPEQGLIN